MSFTSRFPVALAVLPLCCCLHLRQLGNASAAAPVVIPLHNDDDMVMSATIQFGSEGAMKCVMDTGSFEQVVFSSKCGDCGDQTYDCDADEYCHWGWHESAQEYGSGGTQSREAHTQVKAISATGSHSITVPKQMVWLVTHSDLDAEIGDMLQCIFGLGPASSAVEFAKKDVQSLKALMDPEGGDAGIWAATLHNLEKHLQFVKSVSLWQESAKVDTMSFCLHPEFGEDGRLIFNDRYPDTQPHVFLDVPAAGPYWQADMTDVSIPLGHKAMSACGGGPKACSAVMDTGTSLIGAPAAFVQQFSNQLAELLPKYGCDPDALGKYPDFTFRLGGHSFTLPPRSYVCKFPSADWEALAEDVTGPVPGRMPPGGRAQVHQVQQRLQHVHKFKKAHDRYRLEASLASKGDKFFCAPCFFDYGRDSDAEEWLFGLPFFREYYTTFRTDAEYTSAKKMQFAKTSADCVPHKPTGQRDVDFLARAGVQHVHLHRLRFPPL